MILGLPWLEEYNPKIDWDLRTIDITSVLPKTTFGKILRRTIKLSKMEILIHTPKPTIKEIFKDNDSLSQTIPLPFDGPLLMHFDEEPYEKIDIATLVNDENEIEEFCSSDFRSYLEKNNEDYEDYEQDRVWVRAKTSISQELAQKLEKEKPRTELPDTLIDYRSVFEKKPSERLPTRKTWDHAIDLKPDFIPRDCKIYPMTPEEQGKLEEFINENLNKGYIRPSKSPNASPFFCVSKKDSKKLHPCQDYRRLNDATIKNAYPLPRVGDLLDKLKGAKYFTKLDLRWGYNNVRIKEGNEWKAAFKTNLGLFEPLVMYFGLCNSPGTFQNMMNDILREEINEGWLLVYMDDILIFTDNRSKLIELTRRVLQKLKDNDLFLNLDKCTFDVEEIEYLGMIITENQIKMDPVKLAGIADWPVPTSVKQVRSFLGFGNFYRRFIGHYASIARPLNDLTKKNLVWNWSPDCQQAFDELKRKFQTAPSS